MESIGSERKLPPSALKWKRRNWDHYCAQMAELKRTPEALARARARYHAKMDKAAEDTGIPRRPRGRPIRQVCVSFVPTKIIWVS